MGPLQRMLPPREPDPRAAGEREQAALVGRIVPRLVGGFATLLVGLGILGAGPMGCSASKGAIGTPLLAPFSPRTRESKADRDALQRAVEKDPFPAAKSHRVDLEA